jgi:hypothetical protein
MHDIEQADEGNIDHLVSGPSGVFLIETKHSSYLPDLVTRATPVVCVDREVKRPYQLDRAWIVGRVSIAGWVREQSQPVLASERLAVVPKEVVQP